MSESEPPDFLKGGPALGADGKLEGRLNRIESGGPPPVNDAPLELEERPPKRPESEPVAYRDPLPTPGRRLAVRLIAVAVVAGVALLVAGLLSSRPGRPGNVVHTNTFLDSLLSGGEKHAVVITSEPAGATVKIAGQVVGVTPWAGDNLWAGDAPVVLELEGFKAWKGTIKGGQEAHLNARLTK
ncbi:MAG: PEGA domain-containing protein [Myxococcota bacterium]